MKISTFFLTFGLFASASSFIVVPSTAPPQSPLSAVSRSDFLKAAAGLAFVVAPSAASAMDQTNIVAPTETWETGKPMNKFRDQDNLYSNARTQLNSNFAPIKRLTLERKSPVTRLDLNSPNFDGYKKTYPGLFEKDGKKGAPAAVEAPPPAQAADEAPPPS